MSTQDNLKLWRSVEQTEQEHTKSGEFGGRPVTSINGISVVMKATELWGPIGLNWGYDILENVNIKGAPLMINKAIIPGDYFEVMNTIHLRVWRKTEEGELIAVRHFGHTPFVMNTFKGPMTDFDAPKKSLTDAFKKCLSMWGFNADIHLGKYDDELYVAEVNSDSQVDKKAKDEIDFERDIEAAVEGMKEAKTLTSLKAMGKANVTKFKARAIALNRNSLKVTDYIDEEVRKIRAVKFTESTKTE